MHCDGGRTGSDDKYAYRSQRDHSGAVVFSRRIGAKLSLTRPPTTTQRRLLLGNAPCGTLCVRLSFRAMSFPKIESIKKALQWGRQQLGRAGSKSSTARSIPGQFQTYNHTLPNRYPWLFQFAAESLAHDRDLNLLSFGCSRGDEVFTLRSYFPT